MDVWVQSDRCVRIQQRCGNDLVIGEGRVTWGEAGGGPIQNAKPGNSKTALVSQR